jgi:hypothetical protein
MESFGEDGTSLGSSPLPSSSARPIVPKSTGEYLANFACDRSPGDLPKLGYPTMLPIRVAADQLFRLVGIGLSPDAAAALAAVDAQRAPKTYNDLLNVLVPSERQVYVRAIKTPDEPAQ